MKKIVFLFLVLFMAFVSIDVYAATAPVITFESNGGTDVTNYTLTNNAYSYVGSLAAPLYYRMNDSAVMDYNNDGYMDYVSAGWGNSLLLYESNQGVLSSYQTLITSVNAYVMEVADLDNNGFTDIILADSKTVKILSNNNGIFTTYSLYTSLKNIWSLDTGDLNNDGYLDIVYSADEEIWQILSTGSLTYAAAELLGSAPGTLTEIYVDDVTNDGINDIVYSHHYGASKITYFEGENDGTYVQDLSLVNIQTEIDTSLPQNYRLFLSDMDGDDIEDFIIYANYTQDDAGVIWIKRLSDGTLERDGQNQIIRHTIENGTVNFAEITVADYDGDRDLDVFTYTDDGTSLHTYTNDGTGNFLYKSISVYAINSVQFLDINGDSINDMIDASYSSQRLAKYLSSGEDNYLLSGITAITKTGYNFVGWFYDQALTQQYSSSHYFSADTTLYAKWTPKTFSVSFSGNGSTSGTMTSQTFSYEVEQALSANQYVNTGFVFVEWNTQSDGLGTSYSDQQLVTLQSLVNITLYAIWGVETSTIYFDTDGGTSILPISGEIGAAVTAPDNPTKEGYTFAGWDQVIPQTMPANDLTLTASWNINEYTITFETLGGSSIAAITQDYNSLVTAPDDPTKEGYTFNSWDMIIPATMPASNLTITASWDINEYTMTFNSNGGSIVNSITQDYNTLITAPDDPTKEGYTFDGWDQALPSNMPANDLTLNATWIINQYTITFNTLGGSVIAPITQDYNSIVTAPNNPTKVGYTFVGIFSDQSLLNAYTFSVMPASDITLYVKWQVNTYTVTYNVEGTLTTEDVDYGQMLNDVPQDPQKDGYEFTGWTLNGTLINISTYTQGAQDVELVAAFEDISAPIVTGVSNNISYKVEDEVTITFNEGTATLNGEAFANNTKVVEPGDYTLVVTDQSGNQTTVNFTIDANFNPWIFIFPLLLLLLIVIIYVIVRFKPFSKKTAS